MVGRFNPRPDSRAETVLRFALVTPAIVARLDQKAEPALLGPPVKAALRWWWRAIRWPAIAGAHADEGTGLERLAAEEAMLFGHGALTDPERKRVAELLELDGERVRQIGAAPFGLELVVEEQAGPTTFPQGFGVAYLGYGATARRCCPAGTRFRVRLRIGRELLEGDRPEGTDLSWLARAVRAFGLVGAVGARCRRGFGSVQLLSAEGKAADALVTAEDDFAEAVTQTLGLEGGTGDGDAPLPPFTAISPNARFDLLSPTPDLLKLAALPKDDPLDDPLAALEALGTAYKLYRGNGVAPDLVEVGSGKHASAGRFGAELQWLADVAKRSDKHATRPLERLALGLPLTYRSSALASVANDPKRAAVTLEGPADWPRRASPLLMRVHRHGDEHRVALLTLPARFLPVPHVGLRGGGGVRLPTRATRPHGIEAAGDFTAALTFSNFVFRGKPMFDRLAA